MRGRRREKRRPPSFCGSFQTIRITEKISSGDSYSALKDPRMFGPLSKSAKNQASYVGGSLLSGLAASNGAWNMMEWNTGIDITKDQAELYKTPSTRLQWALGNIHPRTEEVF
jgi:hypothetical protein